MAYNFRFSKYCAHRTYRKRIPFLGNVIQLFKSCSKPVCHNFYEFSCSCGTFIIHQKIPDLTIFQSDYFCILSTYIYNCAVSFKQGVSTSSMASYLCNNFISIVYTYSTVSGCYASHIFSK